MAQVISQANKREGDSNYFEEKGRDFQNWGTTDCAAFYGWPQNCHGTRGCVVQLMYYSEYK